MCSPMAGDQASRIVTPTGETVAIGYGEWEYIQCVKFDGRFFMEAKTFSGRKSLYACRDLSIIEWRHN